MPDFAPHPGMIRMVEEYDKTTKEVRASQVPERSRFVYLREDGVETSNPQEATTRVPIVEVHMLSIDPRGNLVPKEQATKIVIREYGPEGMPLRHTILGRKSA